MSLVIMELISAPQRLSGALQRRMIEVRSGLFVGELTSRIREEIWAEVLGNMKFGSAIMIIPAKNEAGFSIRTHGKDRREVVYFDDFPLLKYIKNWEK